jgi:hypothetical protein
MSNRKKVGLAAGSKTRVTGVATEQVIKATSGILHRIVVTNTTAVATLDISDGASPGGDIIVARIPVDTTVTLDFNVQFDNNIRVTPSNASIDALVIFD